MYFTLFLLTLGAAVGGCAMINEALNVHDDNFVEEYIEIIIENETGIDLDLTPESEEI